ncbi:TIGR02186 family protein [Aurantimonas sp. HBX-1]|nr:TIGR02186 family protein [Aurantimonas sp. HBX-1]UIJ72719.1 TIGR02186 family protein [Aurantimonas sp. HBX-1]
MIGRRPSRARISDRLLNAVAGLLAFMALLVGPARAQLGQETFEIGLSTEQIGITSDFTGARLVVFGALDNADGRILREQRYDIVVALVGPRRPVVVREKERKLGIWINRGSESFEAPPSSYALASTRPLADIMSEANRVNLSIGIADLRLGGGGEPAADDDAQTVVANRDEYATALRRIRENNGLYNQRFGAVQFVSPTLFRADLQLPAGLPTGEHTVRAYLFRQGVFIRGSTETLTVVKTGFESFISGFALEHGILYGIAAVILAIFTGWFGRILFKRD